MHYVTAIGPSKPYGTREDLTTGGPANCPMRRDPFPTHVKLTMRSSRPNLSPMPTAWDNGIAARFMPKRYTSRELVKLAEEFGWMLVGVRGDHHNFKHPASRFIVTIVHPQKDVPVGRAVDTVKKIRLELK